MTDSPLRRPRALLRNKLRLEWAGWFVRVFQPLPAGGGLANHDPAIFRNLRPAKKIASPPYVKEISP